MIPNMNHDQSRYQTISTLRQKHIDICITNIILLKDITKMTNELFPTELILFIIGIVWKLISNPELETFYGQCGSKLMLGDIIDSLSELGKITILKSDVTHSIHFFIEFYETINWNRNGIVIDTHAGLILDTPLLAININNLFRLGSSSMLVYIFPNQMTNITNNVHDSLIKERSEFSNCYVKYLDSEYRFNDSYYNNQLENIEECKRQIMIVWLRIICKEIRNRGFCLQGYGVCIPSTLSQILYDRKDYKIIY